MQKLPIGISEFSELRGKKCVYVDKTKYVYSLLKDHARTFLARPRRFGKSLFVSTLEAALQGKKELFNGLWIAQSDYEWTLYGVIRLDFSQLSSQTVAGFVEGLIYVLKDIGKTNNLKLSESNDLNVVFMDLISNLYLKYQSVAILIDEYDFPILHTLHDTKLAMGIRDVMKSFSCVIKAQSSAVKIVFVTGVSAFSKSGLSSGLNNLDNLTMNERFFDVCGYTDLEVDYFFKEHIEEWADFRKLAYDELRKQLKVWYNGYSFIENTPTVYSPFSFTCSLHIKKLHNFWFESATPQVLLNELNKEKRQNECKILDVDQLRGTWDLLQTFEIESLPLTALLFQMGYLTINSYDPLTRNYKLKYPNLEVRASFQRLLVALVTNKETAHINPLVGDLYAFLVQEKMEEVVAVLTNIISGIPYSLHIEEEKFYHALLQTIFSAAGVEVQSERMTSIGRMDLVLELPNILYILELKMNKSPEEGLNQIETQKYFETFLHKDKPIRAVGLSFVRIKTNKKKKASSDFVISYSMKTIK